MLGGGANDCFCYCVCMPAHRSLASHGNHTYREEPDKR